VAEEALRLLEELRAGHAGPECRVCPICQAIAVLRQVRPEVVEHLSAAAVELSAALREALVPGGREPPAPTRREHHPVEHIDIGD
jgi:hypothetical protein